jgi:predicted MPP superfamily phosphohydrolase
MVSQSSYLETHPLPLLLEHTCTTDLYLKHDKTSMAISTTPLLSSEMTDAPHVDTITLPALPAWKIRLHKVMSAMARSPLAHRLFSALLLCGAPGLGAYAYFVEPTWLKVRRFRLAVPHLPPNFDGFRIVQLSDLHVGSLAPSWFLHRVIDTARALEPDLVVLTGDYVHTRPDNVADLTTLLQPLRAATGLFAVLGNHDYGVNYAGDAGIPGVENVVITALERAGIRVLRNEWLPLGGGSRPFALVGIDELLSGRAQIAPLHKIPTALPRLVLSHNPDIIPFLPENSFDLLLCGHTHGGQIRIPPFRPPVTATKHRQYWGGLFSLGRGCAYVTTGIGYTWRARLAARPECVCITLTGQ